MMRDMGHIAKRAVFVAGMHRSGTSAYTRVLNLLGADLGPAERMVKPENDNPEGYWEHNDLMLVNDKILKAFGQDRDRVNWWPDDWLNKRGIDGYTRRINSILDRDFGQSSLWAFKDPRLCLTLPLWKQVLSARNTECAVFMPVRHPLEVASSLAKRDGMPIETGLAFWLMYNLKSAKASMGMEGLILCYESLLAEPGDTIKRIADFLRISRDSSELSAALASLRPQLRHNRIAPDEAMPALVRKLWELLSAREGGMMEPDDRRVLDEIRDEFVSRRDLAVTRDLSWMAEFDAALGDRESMIRRVAVSIPTDLARSDSIRFCPSGSAGIVIMRNPVLMWEGPNGLQRKSPAILENREILILDRNLGLFLAMGLNAEIAYSLSDAEYKVDRMRLAFDFSFFPLPLQYHKFILANKEIWWFIAFMRNVKRWLHRFGRVWI